MGAAADDPEAGHRVRAGVEHQRLLAEDLGAPPDELGGGKGFREATFEADRQALVGSEGSAAGLINSRDLPLPSASGHGGASSKLIWIELPNVISPPVLLRLPLNSPITSPMFS